MLKLFNYPAVRIIIISFAVMFFIHLLSALTVDNRLEHKEISYSSPRVTEGLNGYRIAFITDIHGYPEKDLKEMVDAINRNGADLVLFGGDFSGQKDLSRCFEILAQINSADGFYGVEGNHDNAAQLRQVMADNGMTLLENNGVHIKKKLYIAGLEDLWNREPNVEDALAEAGKDDFVLMLCHNPDTSMIHDFSNTDLALSGHVHGGEVSFFGIWAPAVPLVSRYGQRFTSGWCKSAANTDIYISNGIGTYILRSFARPQVIYLTLKSSS